MSAIEEDIVKAKENLQNALGERYIEYLYLTSFYSAISFKINFFIKIYAKHEKMVRWKGIYLFYFLGKLNFFQISIHFSKKIKNWKKSFIFKNQKKSTKNLLFQNFSQPNKSLIKKQEN